MGTKYIGRWADLAVDIALEAVNTVTINENGRIEVDIKKFVLLCFYVFLCFIFIRSFFDVSPNLFPHKIF